MKSGRYMERTEIKTSCYVYRFLLMTLFGGIYNIYTSKNYYIYLDK